MHCLGITQKKHEILVFTFNIKDGFLRLLYWKAFHVKEKKEENYVLVFENVFFVGGIRKYLFLQFSCVCLGRENWVTLFMDISTWFYVLRAGWIAQINRFYAGVHAVLIFPLFREQLVSCMWDFLGFEAINYVNCSVWTAYGKPCVHIVCRYPYSWQRSPGCC